jgi:transcriptional regulator with XRE-family HTH domain
MKIIGSRIKEIRKELGLNQREFSKKLGMNQSTLSEVEKGKYNLSIDIIIKLAKEYDVNLYYLLTDDDEMFLPTDVLSLTRIKEYAVIPESIKRFLFHFQGSPIVQHYILSQYRILMAEKGHAILQEVEKFKKEKKLKKE